jgi:hypothetical protein
MREMDVPVQLVSLDRTLTVTDVQKEVIARSANGRDAMGCWWISARDSDGTTMRFKSPAPARPDSEILISFSYEKMQ